MFIALNLVIHAIQYLSRAHHTIQFFAAVIRRTIQATAARLNMIHCSACFILSTTGDSLQVFVEALISSTLSFVISRHEVAIVLALPYLPDGPGGSWGPEGPGGSGGLRQSYRWFDDVLDNSFY